MTQNEIDALMASMIADFKSNNAAPNEATIEAMLQLAAGALKNLARIADATEVLARDTLTQ